MDSHSKRDADETAESLDLERHDQAIEAGTNPAESAPPQGVFAAQYKSHSGPLPDHDWFAGLEAIHPGSTEIILRDFTDEQQHQRHMQEKAIALDEKVFSEFSRYQRARLWIAGGLALFLAVGGLALIFLDKEVYGFVLLVGEIAGLMAVFLARKVSEDDDLDALDEEELDQILAELDDGDES